MRFLVVTSCTDKKVVEVPDQLTLTDFRDPARLAQRERSLAQYSHPAANMYIGPGHMHVMAGVRQLRKRFGSDTVDLKIVSAGYGLLAEERPIVPYNATFQHMGKREALAWARQLGLAYGVREAIRDFPLVIFLLGSDYLQAIEPPVLPVCGQRLVFFAKPAESRRLLVPGVTMVSAGRSQATTYGAGLVALKGRMFALLAASLVDKGDALFEAVCRDDTPTTLEKAMLSAR